MAGEQDILNNALAIQSLIDNAKTLNELDELPGIVNESDYLALWSVNDNKFYKVLKSKIIGNSSYPLIKVSGIVFELIKNIDNNKIGKELLLEPKDIIRGWVSSTQYLSLYYIQGDQSLFTDKTVYTVFAGYEIPV